MERTSPSIRPPTRRSLIGLPLARTALVLRSLPDWAWIAWISATATILNVTLGRAVAAPIVFNDERIYEHLARRIAGDPAGGIPAVARSGYGFVYPLVLAPEFRALSDLPSAYAAAKVVGAILLASAAIPAFLLARRSLPEGWAVAATALTVIGPQAVFSGLIMTENAFFPLFLWTALAAVRMLEHPTLGRQAVAVGAIVAAVATRLQAIALLPGLLLAVLILGIASPGSDLRAGLRPYLRTIAAAAALAILVPVAALATGHSVAGLLGSYGVLAQGYSPLRTLRWLAANLADLDLLFGFALFAALPAALAAAFRGPSSTAASRSLAAVLVGFGSTSLLLVSAFSGSKEGEFRVHERYLIYFLPLVLMIAFGWIAAGCRASRRTLVPGILAASLLPLALPLAHMAAQSWVDTLAAQPWLNTLLDGRHLTLISFVTAAVVATGVLAAGERRGPYVLVFFGLAAFLAFASVRAHARSNGRFAVARADWIDRAAGQGATVQALFVPKPCLTIHQRELRWIRLWRAEFFNRSVHIKYFVRQHLPGDLDSLRLTLRSDGTLVRNGSPVRVAYALVQPGVELRGQVVATDPLQRLTLVRVEGPLRLAAQAQGHLTLSCPRRA